MFFGLWEGHSRSLWDIFKQLSIPRSPVQEIVHKYKLFRCVIIRMKFLTTTLCHLNILYCKCCQNIIPFNWVENLTAYFRLLCCYTCCHKSQFRLYRAVWVEKKSLSAQCLPEMDWWTGIPGIFLLGDALLRRWANCIAQSNLLDIPRASPPILLLCTCATCGAVFSAETVAKMWSWKDEREKKK